MVTTIKMLLYQITLKQTIYIRSICLLPVTRLLHRKPTIRNKTARYFPTVIRTGTTVLEIAAMKSGARTSCSNKAKVVTGSLPIELR